ncbi:MAG: RNA-splicing ligase RtcB [Acidimicrobiia bacterium]
MKLEAAGEYRYEVAPEGKMRVPAVIFASPELIPDIVNDKSIEQAANVATLPGIVRASFAMPDIHWGYGFPIGGVAATDVEAGGVISPGGVGFDISCGVRLLISDYAAQEISDQMESLMDELARRIPKGLGKGGVWSLSGRRDLMRILLRGSAHAVEQGYGVPQDVENCEDRGFLDTADPDALSERAYERGFLQVGSLGSGNHFLEVQRVDRIYDRDLADAFGLADDQVCVMIHCGSRGLGHQVCSDSVKEMLSAMARYGIEVPDKQLACAPVKSPEGQKYLAAMAAAANYGRANRQALTHATRQAFQAALGDGGLRLLYDVSHNLAKIERHLVDDRELTLCVHRKGATRSLPPNDPELPHVYKRTGQPVLVPGSMGTGSFVCAGLPDNPAFNSTCHGAGRRMSRHQATKKIRGEALKTQLESQGIRVRSESMKGLAEEAPFAYKNVDEVVEVCERAGLAKRVARLVPIGVVKG